MQHNQVEQLDALERRIALTVELQAVESEVSGRLKQIARTARVAGFRHGKVPMSLVTRQYGDGVRQEVLGKAIEQAFSQAVDAHKLRVAGYPRIEPRLDAPEAGKFACYAVFEVYPDIVVGDLSAREIVRPVVALGDAEVDKTLSVLAKQRAEYRSVARAAQSGARLTLDFEGRIDGEIFEGGEAKGFKVELGSGQTLPEFESGLLGATAGQTLTLTVNFPANYHASLLAGKTAIFTITVHEVAEQVLPTIDAAFAISLGMENGDVAAMRAEILANLQREVKQRVNTRLREQVMQALLEVTPFEPPKILVQTEAQRLMQQAQEDMQARGMEVANANLPMDVIGNQARQRIVLGLIVSQIIQDQHMNATQEQAMAVIDELAQSYEEPHNVIEWYRRTPEKMREVTSQVLENQVIDWVLAQARLKDEPVTFEALMGRK